MEISAEFLQKVAEAVAADRMITRNDMLAYYAPEITVNADFLGYANPRVTRDIDSLTKSEVTHLKFCPFPEEGYLILLPAAARAPGAVSFVRSESRRTATFNMRMALSPFGLGLTDGRKLSMAVSTVDIEIESAKRPVMFLQVKRPSARKSVSRPRKRPADGGAQADPTVGVDPSNPRADSDVDATD